MTLPREPTLPPQADFDPEGARDAAESWRAARRLFEATLDLSEDERAVVMSESCADPRLAARVQRLLASASLSVTTIDRGALGLLQDSAQAPSRPTSTDLRGRVVAGYTLVEPIAAG